MTYFHDIQYTLDELPQSHEIILMGYFNANVGNQKALRIDLKKKE
jgi:hypothetical protein